MQTLQLPGKRLLNRRRKNQPLRSDVDIALRRRFDVYSIVGKLRMPRSRIAWRGAEDRIDAAGLLELFLECRKVDESVQGDALVRSQAEAANARRRDDLRDAQPHGIERRPLAAQGAFRRYRAGFANVSNTESPSFTASNRASDSLRIISSRPGASAGLSGKSRKNRSSQPKVFT